MNNERSLSEIGKRQAAIGNGSPIVLQLIDSFNQGGSERQALQLTRLLTTSNQFQVRLASLNPEGSLRAEIADLDLGEIPAFPLNSFYDRNALTQLKGLIEFLQGNQVSIIHTHDFYTNVFGMAAGKIAGVPVRIASLRETGGMRTKTQQRVQRIAYTLSQQVITNSQAVRDEAVRQGVAANKLTVIYNGIDLRRVTVDPAHSIAESFGAIGLKAEDFRDRRVVTIVANMRHEVKDYPLFLRAARRVVDVVPNVSFLMAGEGELLTSVRELANELQIADHAYFLGRCEALAHLLRVSDVCVLSSRAEGFSNSILEYMAAGRPVVATDVGGAREVIEENVTGHIVPPGDDESMAARIIDLLTAADLESMGTRARQIIEEKFSLERQREQTESLYRRCLGGS